MGTKSALRAQAMARLAELEPGRRGGLDVQNIERLLEHIVNCYVCDNEFNVHWKWWSYGGNPVCLWCERRDGRRLARVKFLVSMLASRPCEGGYEGLGSDVDLDGDDIDYELWPTWGYGMFAWMHWLHRFLTCKCVPCTARLVLRDDPPPR